MRYPVPIKEHDTIGFPAPSFGCSFDPYKSAFDNAMKKLQEMGYLTQPGPNAYLAEGIGISNTPEKCADEFMDMWMDPEVSALISCGGGELMCEILEYLDFDAIKNSVPKWFMGYSDNTNLVYTLTTSAGIAAVYGPCISSFGQEPWHESLKDAFGLLDGTQDMVHAYDLWEKDSLKDELHPLVPYNLTESRMHKIFINGELLEDATKLPDAFHMKGRLLGGCLDCLANLVGTKFDKTADFAQEYAQDGILWFLESCDLSVFAIRRALWQCKQAGWFKNVNGFLIGRPANGEQMFNLDRYRAVIDILRDFDVPIILDMDIGHCAPMIPLISGSYADVHVYGNACEILMELK